VSTQLTQPWQSRLPRGIQLWLETPHTLAGPSETASCSSSGPKLHRGLSVSAITCAAKHGHEIFGTEELRPL